jgi:hypothetical protein
VWAIRYVIAALLAGFQQVRFHSAGTSYDPLVFEADSAVKLRPLGRALLFLRRWLPVGSRIVSVSHDPRVLAVTVTRGVHRSAILSSFASKPLSFPLRGHGRVRLLPNAIVALRLR